MRQIPIDEQTERAAKKEALLLRRERMDKSAVRTVEDAATVVRFECLDTIIRTNRSVV